MDASPQVLKEIWGQQRIPVVLRRGGKGELLRVRLPFSEDNRDWLGEGRRSRPTWLSNKACWETPKNWFDDFVKKALKRYGKLYVIQPFREQEVCAPACKNATGHECQCSCMGAYHGTGRDGSWFEYQRLLRRDGGTVT